MTDDIQQEFKQQRISEIAAQGEDASLKSLTRSWFDASCRHNYCYHFDWLSRPIIQFPQDVLAMQEILWRVKPDLVVECGIAHGGFADLQRVDAGDDRLLRGGRGGRDP